MGLEWLIDTSAKILLAANNEPTAQCLNKSQPSAIYRKQQQQSSSKGWKYPSDLGNCKGCRNSGHLKSRGLHNSPIKTLLPSDDEMVTVIT